MKLTKKLIFPILALPIVIMMARLSFKTEGELTDKAWNTQVQKRSPASTYPVRCFADRAREELVVNEVNDESDHYKEGEKLSWVYQDQTYEKLPLGTIEALNINAELNSTHGTSWTMASPAQKSCTDYACFVNSLYSSPQNEGAYYYHFFLKTGYLLAAQTVFPFLEGGEIVNYTVKDAGIDRYLWNQRELKGLWLVSSLLPKSMVHLDTLSSIHRIPRDFIPSSWQKLNATCGSNYGAAHFGVVVLGDECLRLDPKNVLSTRNDFYPSVIHEIAHSLDHAQAELGGSRDPDFLKFDEWKKEELVADGQTEISWSTKKVTGFVSRYSMSSPGEDFAENIAYFRTNPERLMKSGAEKYEYIKHRYFEDQDYLPAKRLEAYAQDITHRLMPSALQLEPAQLIEQIDRELNRVRFEEPEGCSVIDPNEVILARLVYKKLNALRTPGSAQVQDESLHALRSGLGIDQNENDSAIALTPALRAGFLNCWFHSGKTANLCYAQFLKTEFERVAGNTFSEEVLASESLRAKKSLSFETVRLKVSEFYNSLFQSVDEDLKGAVSDTWSECFKQPVRTKLKPVLAPYQPGTAYITASFLNCLNQNIEPAMASVRGKVMAQAGLSAFTEDGIAWSRQILLPKFKSEWDARIASGSTEEKKLIQKREGALVNEVVAEMLDHRSWAANRYTLKECFAESAIEVGLKLEAFQYHFTSLPPVLKQYQLKICSRVKAAF